ncbi:MAG: Mut7-C RNAse domain-containing protein [Syntrophales bacterium]|jgi:hypothetical protein|nr:Mut7-C RNAse domain-containing protein [Syntrophales bacterium]
MQKNNLEPIFICDIHLGKLVRLLRLLGFDTVYRNYMQHKEIIKIAKTDQCIILARDQGILGSRSINSFSPMFPMPDGQIREVLMAFNLRQCITPFSWCMDFNGEIG